MLVWVTEARHAGGYRLWLRFNDGVAGEVDLESRLFGEVFEPLRDPLPAQRLEHLLQPREADLVELPLHRIHGGHAVDVTPRAFVE